MKLVNIPESKRGNIWKIKLINLQHTVWTKTIFSIGGRITFLRYWLYIGLVMEIHTAEPLVPEPGDFEVGKHSNPKCYTQSLTLFKILPLVSNASGHPTNVKVVFMYLNMT
jgi:hypothetical protein